MPRSEMPEIPREILQDTLIDVMRENDRLRARIAELEAAIQYIEGKLTKNSPNVRDELLAYTNNLLERET